MTAPKNPLIIGDWTHPEFEFLANNVWVFTEKVDGTNIRVIFDETGISFGGRTDAAQIQTSLLTRLQDRFQNEEETFAAKFPHGAVLYGEGYGAKIQKGGGNYRQDQDFVLFDVKIGDWWLQRSDVEDIGRSLGLDVVPITGTGTLHQAILYT
jgi:hypothetical protein